MTVRMGVIGLGEIGRHHLRVLNELATVEVVAVCDQDPARLAEAARGRTAARFVDFQKMLASVPMEAVVVAVPTSLHQEVTVIALDAGLHVLVEKPIAATEDEALAMLEAADARGRILAVGHLERLNPAIVEMKRQIDAGLLGEIFLISTRRLSPYPARMQDVGVVIDLATHDLDLMRYLTDAEPERFHAETARVGRTQHEDFLIASLRFANGVLGSLSVNWMTPTKIREIIVNGSRGMFYVNLLTQELTFYENRTATGNWDSLQTLGGVAEGNAVRYALERVEPLRAQAERFVAAVGGSGSPAVTAIDGLAALRLAHALLDSARIGMPAPRRPAGVA